MEFSILGGGGLPDFQNFFEKKKYFFIKKYKDDQNGLIHPEKWRLEFFNIRGVKAEITAVSRTFWLQPFCSKHF